MKIEANSQQPTANFHPNLQRRTCQSGTRNEMDKRETSSTIILKRTSHNNGGGGEKDEQSKSEYF
jgi:hypothetical protein